MKVTNFQDDISSIPFGNFRDHYVVLRDLTSRQDATENCPFPELVGKLQKVEFVFAFPLEHVTDLSAFGENIIGCSRQVCRFSRECIK